MAELPNPFDLVKATDLTDAQIEEYFVDFAHGATLLARLKPTSPMPMIIFGGKGSGKTHLMRYLSYALQVRRSGRGSDGRAGISRDGYLGIYFRCGGLNAQRFSGKGQTAEVWQQVFAYYMELWLGQLVLRTVADLYADSPTQLAGKVISDITDLLDVKPTTPFRDLGDAIGYLEQLQRAADVAINNCAITKHLDIRVSATPGRLVFGLPAALVRQLKEVESVLFLYLIDEFENLTEPQQRYINTLVRERQFPSTMKIGVRAYGLRTKQTLSAGEENRENSEFDALHLDSELRDRPDEAQVTFAKNLVRKRLLEAGYLTSSTARRFDPSASFQVPEQANIVRSPLAKEKEPSYFATARKKLIQGFRAGAAPGVSSEADVDVIINTLKVPDDVLTERTNLFLLYRGWSRRRNLLEEAKAVAESAKRYLADEKSEHAKVLRYFRSDLVAQLLRETKQKQRYAGFEAFVKMSAGLPRGLLTILKHVFTWSLFLGEKPFRDGPISVEAQTEGVAQASEWFFAEARAPGEIGILVRDGMTRLGQLLRDLRFSDKPSESSLSTFSAELATASDLARTVLNESENWSMLIRIAGGQHDRNEGRVDNKYQVHPMLAPRWDLPIARRGALALSGEEIDAIFAPSSPEIFDKVLKRRLDAMTAPYFGSQPGRSDSHEMFPRLSDG